MHFAMLGPLSVTSNEGMVSLPSAKQRAVLAALLLSANRAVSVSRLVEAVWGGPPVSARKLVATYVWQLRRSLAVDGPPPITHVAGGYVLRATAGCLDVANFDRLVRRARTRLTAGEHGPAAELYDAALALWRGDPLQDTPLSGRWRSTVDDLAERRLLAIEELADANLALARYPEVITALAPLAAAHPLRESVTERLMLALHRGGRRADALAAFLTLRRALRDELGREPGERLRALQRVVLTGDAAPAPAHGRSDR